MSEQFATVEVLTAEVRALMIGNRQVTLSVYRQLDHVPASQCDPFGRVSDPQEAGGPNAVRVVGRDRVSGALVSSSTYLNDRMRRAHQARVMYADPHPWESADLSSLDAVVQRFADWQELPLIVLAGLR